MIPGEEGASYEGSHRGGGELAASTLGPDPKTDLCRRVALSMGRSAEGRLLETPVPLLS